MGLLDFLNVVLVLPPAVSIILISGIVAVVTAIIYKYTTNQAVLKQVKEDVKRLQAEVRATKEPARAAELQKEIMKSSMKQLNSSYKSMFITLIPLLLLFGWMRGHLAYEPVMPGEEFTTSAYFAKAAVPIGSNITLSTSEGMNLLSAATQEIKSESVSWRLKGGMEGNYRLSYAFGSEAYSQNVIISAKSLYADPILSKSNGIKKDSTIEKIVVGLKSVRPFGSLSLFGYMPGWVATYFVASVVFSMLVRKLLKLY